jgi:hypothetical protein
METPTQLPRLDVVNLGKSALPRETLLLRNRLPHSRTAAHRKFLHGIASSVSNQSNFLFLFVQFHFQHCKTPDDLTAAFNRIIDTFVLVDDKYWLRLSICREQYVFEPQHHQMPAEHQPAAFGPACAPQAQEVSEEPKHPQVHNILYTAVVLNKLYRVSRVSTTDSINTSGN